MLRGDRRGGGLHVLVSILKAVDFIRTLKKATIDLQHEQIARTLGEGHRVIHGAAGLRLTGICIIAQR